MLELYIWKSKNNDALCSQSKLITTGVRELLLRKYSNYAKWAINFHWACKYHSHKENGDVCLILSWMYTQKWLQQPTLYLDKQQMSLEKTYQSPCTDEKDESLLAPFAWCKQFHLALQQLYKHLNGWHIQYSILWS